MISVKQFNQVKLGFCSSDNLFKHRMKSRENCKISGSATKPLKKRRLFARFTTDRIGFEKAFTHAQ
jgi:hypothetical protein